MTKSPNSRIRSERMQTHMKSWKNRLIFVFQQILKYMQHISIVSFKHENVFPEVISNYFDISIALLTFFCGSNESQKLFDSLQYMNKWPANIYI